MIMNIGIFTGGKHAPYKIIKQCLKRKKLDYLIAADSGLETLDALSLEPNCILGDFDSLKNRALLKKYRHIPTVQFPCDKDFTDTELAMQQAFKILDTQNQKCETENDIIIFGAGGAKRLDHLLYFLRIFSAERTPSVWLFNSGTAFCISAEGKNRLNIKLPPGTIVSSFHIPILGRLQDVAVPTAKILSDGLHWPLNALDWSKQASVSNRNDKEIIHLEALEGRFLILIHGHKFRTL